jgi:hypothetical protein
MARPHAVAEQCTSYFSNTLVHYLLHPIQGSELQQVAIHSVGDDFSPEFLTEDKGYFCLQFSFSYQWPTMCLFIYFFYFFIFY